MVKPLAVLALLALVSLQACDAKPSKPPTPKIDATPTLGADIKPAKDDAPTQTGY